MHENFTIFKEKRDSPPLAKNDNALGRTQDLPTIHFDTYADNASSRQHIFN